MDGARGAFASWPVTAISLSLLVAWLAAVCLMSARHEPWGDEVRALTLSLEPAHWWQLPAALRNEGHPVLWYLLLRFAHDLFGTTAVLKGASITVAFLSVCLLFWRGPFPLWWKSLFTFSFLPFYEYSVMARNYGISMLLVFAFAAAYPLRRGQPYLLALLLALLANTNVHCMPMTAGLLALWIWDEALAGGRRGLMARAGRLALPVLLVILALLGAVATCIPERGYAPPGVVPLRPEGVAGALGTALVHPGGTFSTLLPFSPAVRDCAVGALLGGLIAWPPGLLVLFGYEIVLQALFIAVYPGGLRQQGLLLVAAIALYWMAAERTEPTVRSKAAAKLARAAFVVSLFGLFPLIFLVHIWLSRGPISLDWDRPFSSNKAFAAYLKTTPGMGSAILIPEPDSNLESLAYYAHNRMFFPRQARFERRVDNTRPYRKDLTLGDLLRCAAAVGDQTGAPVLLVLGGQGFGSGPGSVTVGGWRTFRWSDADLEAFRRETRRVASFRGSVSGEDYDVYEWAPR